MLRFERLSDPSWTLLYLDPGCEGQLGLAANDLCSSTGFPYARLMEPAARPRLHEELLAQLTRNGGNYRIRYRLHMAERTFDVLETGEYYQQHGQELLRGYLLICEPREDDNEISSPLVKEYLQLLARLRAQQDLLAKLATHRYGAKPLQEAAELITEAACAIYAVSYGSVWMIEDTTFKPVTQFKQGSGTVTALEDFDSLPYPRYIHALHGERVIDAYDARNDLRTYELAEYFKSRGVVSLLEAGIHTDGELVGVLRLEHTGENRQWQMDEIAFAGELADHIGQAMLNHQRLDAIHSLHLFQRAVEQASSACLLLDRDGRIKYVNPSFTAITQYTSEEALGRNIAKLPVLEDIDGILRDTRTALAHNSSWQGEFRGRRKNLIPYWGHLSVSKVLDSNRRLSNYVVIYEDVTENKLAQQRIERLAYTDNLTGLANRTCFIQTLEKRFNNGDAPNLMLLLVDIDNFKRINDSLGHRIGDKLLVKLARRLINMFETRGLVSRFASNEFAILLDDQDQESGRHLARQILDILDKPLYIDGQLISISGSAGLACAPQHGLDPQTLMKHAGLALHKAKANGKNQLQTFITTLNAEADFRLFLENSLRRALVQEELELFYQPKVCLHTGKLLGLEALLRWRNPEKGMIQPSHFISVAEETGLIIPIGKWAARQACRMGKQLAEQGISDLHIAINLSSRQFADPSLVASLADILAEEQLPPQRLELELTESLLLDATEETHQQLNELKAMGLTLAMDDFGTGYSSLSYLKKFPIDVIKIDRSFIKDIPDSEDDMEITSAVIAMAHNLKLKVVAEGIETSQQLAFLRRQHCDIGQGYLFDRPIPSQQLVERLRRYLRKP